MVPLCTLSNIINNSHAYKGGLTSVHQLTAWRELVCWTHGLRRWHGQLFATHCEFQFPINHVFICSKTTSDILLIQHWDKKCRNPAESFDTNKQQKPYMWAGNVKCRKITWAEWKSFVNKAMWKSGASPNCHILYTFNEWWKTWIRNQQRNCSCYTWFYYIHLHVLLLPYCSFPLQQLFLLVYFSSILLCVLIQQDYFHYLVTF